MASSKLCSAFLSCFRFASFPFFILVFYIYLFIYLFRDKKKKLRDVTYGLVIKSNGDEPILKYCQLFNHFPPAMNFDLWAKIIIYR